MHMLTRALQGMVGWVVDAQQIGTLKVQYYSTIGSHYTMVNDGNGVPQMQVLRLSGCGNKGAGGAVSKPVAWSAVASTKGNHNFGKSFDTVSTINVPKASNYLVLSSYRIIHRTSAGSFVAARLTYPGGTSRTRMIVENFTPTNGFNNYGGSVRVGGQLKNTKFVHAGTCWVEGTIACCLSPC